MTTDNSPPTRTIRFIGNILSSAIKLWLRSQVQQVSDLEVQIAGTNHQIVTGNIPQVSILARDAVYQGLHVAKINLVATDIKVNLGQVVKGQPLKLLQKVPVKGTLQLQQADINASLRSPLLSNALTELLLKLVPQITDKPVRWDKVIVNDGQISLNATIERSSSDPQPIILQAGLKLANCHQLEILEPKIVTLQGVPLANLDNFNVDLGEEVDLDELTLHFGEIVCSGKINVVP